jgi:hypothetical protein
MFPGFSAGNCGRKSVIAMQLCSSTVSFAQRNDRQAPFEDISKEAFYDLELSLKDLDLSKVFSLTMRRNFRLKQLVRDGVYNHLGDKNHIFLSKGILIFSKKGETCFRQRH